MVGGIYHMSIGESNSNLETSGFVNLTYDLTLPEVSRLLLLSLMVLARKCYCLDQ